MAPSRVSPKTDSRPERLSSFLKRINFDFDLSPAAKQKASPNPNQAALFAPPGVSSANASAPVKVAKLKPAAPIEANLNAAPVPLKVIRFNPSASPAPENLPVRFLYSPETKLTRPPSTPGAPWKEDFFPAPRSVNSQQRDSAPLDKNSPEHKERLLAIFNSDISSHAGHVFFQSLTPSTPPSQWDTFRSQSKSPTHNLPVDYIQHTLRSSSIGATMPATDNFGLNSSRDAPESLGLSHPDSSSTDSARANSSLSARHKASPHTCDPLDPHSRTGHSRPRVPQESDFQRPQAVHTPLDCYENERIDHSGPQPYHKTLFLNSQAVRTPGLNFENERTRHYLHNEVHRRAAECAAQQIQQKKEEELKRCEEHERRIVKKRELKLQAQDQRKDCGRRLSRQSVPQGEDDQRRLALARQTEIQGEENQRRLARQAQSLCESNGRHRKEEAERQRKALLAKRNAAELEKERQKLAREKEEAERERQRLAQFKAQEAELQRIAKLRAEEERQRKAEEERQRRAEEERQRIAKLKAEAEERQRRAEEEERRVLAELKAEEERKAREYELLMQDLRQDATDRIQAHLNDRLEAYDNFMAQMGEKISNQAVEINSFENKISAKETQIADLEKQLDDLKSELSSMADAKMGMYEDVRDIQVKNSECRDKAQKLKEDAMAQLEQLKDTSLSSEGVENILNSFITTGDEIEVPELQLSQLSLRDRSEYSDGESSGDEDEEHPVFWAWKEEGVEADRVVKLVNLPTDATVVDIQALVWGGPVAQIVYTPGSTEAKIYFLIGQDAQKYYNDTANHIPYPGDEDRLIRVEKCDPCPRHPFLRWAFEAGATRNVLTTGILPGWTKAELKNFAGKHGRKVEQVLFGKTKSGVRKIEFRFLNIHHANAFKCILKTDIDFWKVETEYAKDQCAVYRNVHLGPR